MTYNRNFNNSTVNFDKPILSQEAFQNAQSLEINIASILTFLNDNNTAILEIIFNVHNPDKGTVTLDSIAYKMYSNKGRILSGYIRGSQSNIFPIAGTGSLSLKDKRVVQMDDIGQDDWQNIIHNSGHYIVNGTFSYKQNSIPQSPGGKDNFRLTFP